MQKSLSIRRKVNSLWTNGLCCAIWRYMQLYRVIPCYLIPRKFLPCTPSVPCQSKWTAEPPLTGAGGRALSVFQYPIMLISANAQKSVTNIDGTPCNISLLRISFDRTKPQSWCEIFEKQWSLPQTQDHKPECPYTVHFLPLSYSPWSPKTPVQKLQQRICQMQISKLLRRLLHRTW